jgi:UDP-N-acetylglucosamine 4,6-dehydratase/UDP-glucose 4-epimerase|tara:strand:- start:237 stop:1235 length:999 start_codon:yes stop_codon:yes gene_type:complete
MFENKKILITGGTGSLGTALTKRLLNLNVDTVRIYSRNESKQILMESEILDDRIRYLIGDVRDLPRLEKALEGIDIVFHAAALKHVPVIEYNPFEAIKTNVLGTQNLIDACLKENVETVVGIGTDKAVSPLNTYGATKLLMEKLLTTAQNYLDIDKYKTKFLAVRYGNVLGSSGSVLPKFVSQIKKKQKITITDPNMTRFSLTMDEALDFILKSTSIGKGTEVFVPKLKAYSINGLKESLFELLENTGEKIISLRPGEKMHETLLNSDELRYVWELDDKYVLFNSAKQEDEIENSYPKIKKLEISNAYSSNTVEKLTKDELNKIILKSKLLD